MALAQPQQQQDPRLTQALDEPLIALTQRCGGDLSKVLGAFFSFLHRRTDFYMVPHDDDLASKTSRMGFRQGDAEKLLLASFRQFPLRKLPRQRPPEGAATTTTTTTDATAKTEDKATTSEKSGQDKDSGAGQQEAASATENDAGQSDKTNPSSSSSDEEETIRRTPEGLQIPIGNGGISKDYRWTQTLEECTVLVAIPPGLRGKDLDVQIKSSFVSISEKKKTDSFILKGDLSERIVPDESTWTLEGGVLSLVLYKKTKTFWATVLAAAPASDKIDTALVDSRRHISDYDAATQGQIRQIMHQQQQERKQQQQEGNQPLPATLTPEQIANAKPLSADNIPAGVEYIDGKKMAEVSKKK